jgi:hypothetical protein
MAGSLFVLSFYLTAVELGMVWHWVCIVQRLFLLPGF